MRDIVLVPCHERPEFTWVCLEYLSRAEGVQDKEIWLCQDQHEMQVVLAMLPVVTFGEKLFDYFHYRLENPHLTYGNSKNLLESLKEAYGTGADRVFLVEDDIMVTPDIFRWHEAILEQPNVFVSCATAVNKSAHFPINGQYAMDESFQDSSAYYLSESAYSSHASAFQRESLGFVVAELANQQTYGRLKPGEEQDLLIQKFKKKSAWPYVPRAFNFGWHSYHISGQKLTGSLEERVVFLRKIVRDQEMLRQVSYNNQAVTAVPSRLHEWNGSVYNVQRYK